MLVYSKDALVNRLMLDPSDAFLIDYWLFLTSDETHSIWKMRPIGLRSIATSAEGLDPRIDGSLTRALVADLETYRLLRPHMDNPCPLVPAGAHGGNANISQPWLAWLKTYKDEVAHGVLIRNLSQALEHARRAQNLTQIAFLVRRLSSELSDHAGDGRPLFQLGLSSLKTNSIEHLTTELDRFTKREDTVQFRVCFTLSPVSISGRAANGFRNKSIELVCTPNQNFPGDLSQQKSRSLEAIVVIVDAYDANHAFQLALSICRKTLEDLRVRHYVRTHLTGAPSVTGGRWDTHLSLHQPFWTPKHGRRKVPHLPFLYRTEDGADALWKSMRWHVSQAIAVWSEDIHNAASHVWQAIEAFSPEGQGARDKLSSFAIEYLSVAPLDLLEYTATKISSQRLAIIRDIGPCDWFPWISNKTSAETWYQKVTSNSFERNFRTWNSPTHPMIAFDKNVGLLSTTERMLRTSAQTPSWPLRRLQLDLEHLYALRNALVHKGQRLGSDSWAAYLARLGLEALFAVSAARESRILRPTIVAQGG